MSFTSHLFRNWAFPTLPIPSATRCDSVPSTPLIQGQEDGRERERFSSVSFTASVTCVHTHNSPVVVLCLLALQ